MVFIYYAIFVPSVQSCVISLRSFRYVAQVVLSPKASIWLSLSKSFTNRHVGLICSRKNAWNTCLNAISSSFDHGCCVLFLLACLKHQRVQTSAIIIYAVALPAAANGSRQAVSNVLVLWGSFLINTYLRYMRLSYVMRWLCGMTINTKCMYTSTITSSLIGNIVKVTTALHHILIS